MTPAVLAAIVAGACAGAGAGAAVFAVAGGPAVPAGLSPPARWRALAARWHLSGREIAAAAAAGAAVLGVTGWPAAGLAAVPAAVALPRILSRRRPRERIAMLEALETWTRRLADLLAASRGLEDAIAASAAAAPAPLRPAASGLAAALARMTPPEQALRAFADAVDDPVGDLIAAALMLAADRRGPGVRAVLSELAADVALDVGAARETEAERASYRTGLAWIVAFLLAYTAYLVIQPSYSAPFGTAAGQLVLAAVACCYGGGLYWLHKLALSGAPGRFLRARPAGGGQP